MEIFFASHRLDWGFGNPNKTAALIVMLMIAVWALAYIRREGFWVALFLFCILAPDLLATASRGGIVACIVGVGILVLYAKRPWPKSCVIAGMIVGIGLVVLGARMQVGDRIERSVIAEDQSIHHRWLIWKEVPRMMVDAPGGWGLGRSGAAYMQWYQPLDHNEGYRTLVSSHLTWLVELGWLGRIAYVWGWGLALAFCWPGKERRWFPIPFATWISYWITAGFSSVAESPWLWVIPGIGLLVVFVIRFKKTSWIRLRTAMVVAGASAGLLGIFCSIGLIPQKEQIHFCSNRVVIGKGAPSLWILPDTSVFGDDYGHQLRLWRGDRRGNQPTIGVVASLKDVPLEDGLTIVTGGRMGADSNSALDIKSVHFVLLNPLHYPQELGITGHSNVDKIFFGEFSESSTSSAWRQVASVQILPGVGDYLPQWTKELNAN